LVHYGLEADALFVECGLDPRTRDDARARYPAARVRALWHMADQAIEDPCWALTAGNVWRPTDFHALGYAFLASHTLESALLRMERYTRIVATDGVVSVAAEPTGYSFTYSVPDPSAYIVPLIDSRLSVLARMCRDACGEPPPLQEVHLSHGRQACAYEEFFGCPVRYDAECGKIIFSSEGIRRPLPAVNRDLARINDRTLAEFARSLSESTWTGRVRKAVMEQLSAGKPSTAQIARVLTLAPRTMQRKLQEEGTSFQAVLDDVRKDLAIQLVHADELDLGEVAYLTGFSGASSFARSYKAWTGRTPSEDRRQT
jgi:AraC-like DNA-binding protein